MEIAQVYQVKVKINQNLKRKFKILSLFFFEGAFWTFRFVIHICVTSMFVVRIFVIRIFVIWTFVIKSAVT